MLERARRIADAVLLEGYVLYPYRASATKNQWRWSFGVLAPRAWSEAGGCEPCWMEVQCLVEPADATAHPGPVEASARPEPVEGRKIETPRLTGLLRMLQAERREVDQAVPGAGFQQVDSLEVDGALHLPWDEGAVREIALDHRLETGDQVLTFDLSGGERVEPIVNGRGGVAGRLRWRSAPLSGVVRIAAEPVVATRPLLKLRIRVENLTPWHDSRARREEILAASCLSTHLLLSVERGAFVSLLDPPAWAAEAAAGCRSVRCWPVLAGEPGDHQLVLAAPIVLYDHPRLAPESPGDFFDATEIDELLALRTATLTDEEQREARATDRRAAALLDRVAGLAPETFGRLHGALRDLEGSEMVPRRATPPAAAGPYQPGDKVRLRPGARRTDAQDLLLAGRTATVREVKRDVDDQVWLAVTLDDDPGADLHDWFGRYHHFRLDEVEQPVDREGAAP